jgi:chromatin remodeling complex protein RSC6
LARQIIYIIFIQYYMAKKANAAFMKPKTISEDLAKIVGKGPMPTTEVISKLWVYIKKNNLQNPKNKRMIVADDALKKVMGQKEIHMMKMMTPLFKHLS